MEIPFTTSEFLTIYARYNSGIWPFQIVLHLMGFLAVLFCFLRVKRSEIYISLLLSFFWIWTGIVYHWVYSTPFNRFALIFGGLYIIQGIIFFRSGVLKKELEFLFYYSPRDILGLVLVLYAMVIYPVIGIILGETYPQTPTFGLPSSVVIFSLGLLLWSDKKLHGYIYYIPVLWSALGFIGAIRLGIKEDIGMLLAGLLTIFFAITTRNEKAV